MNDLIPNTWRTSLARLRENINEALERWIDKAKRGRREDADAWSPALYEAIAGGVDLDETDDALIARTALPGLGHNDFTVEVTGNRLVIRGGRKSSSGKKSRDFSRFEETSSAFAKAATLPVEVDPDRAEAKYKNGLLTIMLPKTEAARNKRIKISVA